MSLKFGELWGELRLDDSAMRRDADQAVSKTQTALRGIADVGDNIGRETGSGLARGLGGSSSKLRSAGKDAGDDIGRGLEAGVREQTSGGWADNIGRNLAASLSVAAVGAMLMELRTIGTEMELLSGKTRIVFGESSDAVLAWADTVNESMGLSAERVAALAASTGDLLKPLGFTAQQAAMIAPAFTNLSAALAAWSGGKLDAAETTEVLNSAMMGEYDALKQLGVAINAEELDARAAEIMAQTGATEGQAKALATLALVQEKSTDAQNYWNSSASDSLKAQNEVNAKWEESKEKLGKALMPALTEVADWLTTSGPLSEQFWEDFRRGLEVIGDLAMEVGQKFFDFGMWVVSVWESTGLDSLMSGTWNAIVAIFQGGADVVMGIWNTFAGLFTGDWGRMWDGIKQVASGIWSVIADQWGRLWRGVVEILGGALGAVWSWVTGAFDGLVGWLSQLPGRVWGVAQGMFRSIVDFARDAVWGVMSWIGSLPGKLAEAAGSIGQAAWNLGANIIGKITDGISRATGVIGDVASRVWGAIKDFLNEKFIAPIRGFRVEVFGAGLQPFGFLPKLHSGGVVPGALGSEVPILALAGERVRTVDQERELQRAVATLAAAVDVQIGGAASSVSTAGGAGTAPGGAGSGGAGRVINGGLHVHTTEPARTWMEEGLWRVAA